MKMFGLGLMKSKKSGYEVLSRGDDRRRRTRKGYVGVYVGEEHKRYEVPIKYLSIPAFQTLMKRSEVYDSLENTIDGPIVLSCTTHLFEELLKIAKEY